MKNIKAHRIKINWQGYKIVENDRIKKLITIDNTAKYEGDWCIFIDKSTGDLLEVNLNVNEINKNFLPFDSLAVAKRFSAQIKSNLRNKKANEIKDILLHEFVADSRISYSMANEYRNKLDYVVSKILKIK